MSRIDIEMDKLRQEYLKVYDLPKGTGIFFSNNGDKHQIIKMLNKFLEEKNLGWNQERFQSPKGPMYNQIIVADE